eukprot:6507945-Pyramimonas_sp.AAC.1
MKTPPVWQRMIGHAPSQPCSQARPPTKPRGRRGPQGGAMRGRAPRMRPEPTGWQEPGVVPTGGRSDGLGVFHDARNGLATRSATKAGAWA